MNKKALTETNIRSKFITPALLGANGEKWNLHTQIREEVTRPGRVIVRGKTVKRGEAKKADYILSYKPNLPLAVIEAKDNTHAVGAGMQQALEYAEILDVPFAYSSNGDAFLVDRNILADQTKTNDFNLEASVGRGGVRGYGGAGQGAMRRNSSSIPTSCNAAMRRQNRAIYPVANSPDGLGHRGTENFSKSVARPLRKRSTQVSRLRTFGTAMTKITNRTVDKSFEIYLCLYQAVTGTEEEQNIYKQFSPGFFDLVIIDKGGTRAPITLGMPQSTRADSAAGLAAKSRRSCGPRGGGNRTVRLCGFQTTATW